MEETIKMTNDNKNKRRLPTLVWQNEVGVDGLRLGNVILKIDKSSIDSLIKELIGKVNYQSIGFRDGFIAFPETLLLIGIDLWEEATILDQPPQLHAKLKFLWKSIIGKCEDGESRYVGFNQAKWPDGRYASLCSQNGGLPFEIDTTVHSRGFSVMWE